jgi:hypothetical protein
MPMTTCPHCRAELEIDPADLGHRVECPACRAAFVADQPVRLPTAEPDRDRKPRHRLRTWNDEDDLPEDLQWRARHRLHTPGQWLQVLGWIDVGIGGLSVIVGAVMLIAALSGPGGGWEVGAYTLGQGVATAVVGGLKGIGGGAMKRVRNRPLSVTTAVAACVPLNLNCCLWMIQGPLYLLGLAFGVAALSVLFRADVKKAFEMNRPDGDLDAA